VAVAERVFGVVASQGECLGEARPKPEGCAQPRLQKSLLRFFDGAHEVLPARLSLDNEMEMPQS
jgi:hypothetical protein